MVVGVRDRHESGLGNDVTGKCVVSSDRMSESFKTVLKWIPDKIEAIAKSLTLN